MDKEFEPLARHLANNLMELRSRRNLTQQALANLVDVPRSTIANLESGNGNPSLSNLARLSAALHTPIDQLLLPQRAICTLIDAKDIPTVDRSHGQVKVYKLLPDSLPNMEIDRIEIQPGAQMKGIPHATGTKEYLHCIEGEITVSVLGEHFKVLKGDVLAFPGEVGHIYINSGKKVSVGVSVIALVPVGI